MIINYNPLGIGRDTWLKNDVGDISGAPPKIHQKNSRTTWFSTLMLMIVILFAGPNLLAQVNAYGFAQSTGTYTPLATSTALYGASSTTWDDNVATATIPFSYTFNGVAYTAVSVNSNGYVTFGTTVSLGSGYTPISATRAYAGSISAFGRDLVNNASTVVTGTEGSSPNRVFVIQWNNARRYDGAVFAPVAGDVLNFQIRLYETTNVAEVRYGTNTATSTTAFTTQVGLRGANNAAFLNRTSATSWTATTNGATNAATVNTTNLIMPTSGLTFTWTPPSPCSGTPAPGNTVTSAASVCSGGTATLSLQNTTPGSGVSYQWRSGTSAAGPFNNIALATSATYVATVTAPTWYVCDVTCSAVTTTSNPVGVSLNAPTACYCTPTITNGCTDGDVIARVILNTLDNNSGTGCPGGLSGYSDYTTNPALTTTLQAGSNYNITLYAGQYSEAYAAWIDYNDNGVFDNPSERIGFSPGLITGSGQVGVLGSSASFPIAIACNPPIGQHRMRIRAQYDTASGVQTTSGSQVTPCGNNGYGEVEDYLITITAAAACPQPSALTATGTSSTGGTLSWTIGCVETAWQVVVQAAGSGTPTGAGVPVSGTPSYTVSGLTPGAYEFYVRADCSGSGFSLWSGPYQFTPPSCPTLISPANGATNVAMPGGGVPLTWSAPAGATSYDVYFGQTAGATVLLGNIAATTVNITGVANGSTNYWKIIAKSLNGDSVGCTESSFTTVSCGAQAVPYTQGFETIGFANVLADCVTSTPAPAASGKVQTFLANATATNSALIARTGTKFVAVNWTPTGKGTIYSAPLQLTAGVSYRATVYYNTDGNAWQTVGLYWGTANNEAAMTNVIATVSNAAATTYTAITGDFIAPTTGTYYVAMQANNTVSSLENFCAFDDFSVSISPTIISSFSPASACSYGGQTVTISGAQFNGATAVQFDGVDAASFVVVNNNTITAVTPAGLTTGYITVNSPFGLGTSATQFISNPAPTVNPITAPGGATNICIPDTLTLSDTTPTGIWSSSDVDIATVDASGIVSPVAVGSVVISYTVTDGLTGCQSAQTYALTISQPVEIIASTPTQTVVTGGNTSFTVTATGTGNPSLTYQWEVNTDGTGETFVPVIDGANYSGATTATLSITDTPASFNGYFYQCIVTGVCNSLISDLAVLLVGETGIDPQPQNATICDSGDGTASFFIGASPDVTNFQWQEDQGGDNWLDIANGGMYAGANTATLSLSGLTLANSGWRYRCQVTGIGSATSNPATLSVIQSVAVNTDPTPQTVCYTGGSAIFSVGASGGIASYQWQYSSNGGGSWNNVVNGTPTGATYSGASSASLTVNTVSLAAGTHSYRAVVNASAPCSAAVSNGASLLINTPAITGQPAAASVVAGNATSFTVVTSAPSPTYQWQYAIALAGPYNNVADATPTGVTYTGATSATLTVTTTTAAAASTARFYRAVVSSPVGCSVNSNGGQLTILNYCTPSYANGTGSGDYISRVVIPTTTLNNTSTGAALPYYTLFPQAGSTTASLFKGSTYTLSVAGGTFGTCYISAWADYNNDGTFAASEFIGVSPNAGASALVNLTTNWLIPNTAVSGNIRIRLRSSDTSPGPTSGQACGTTNSSFGETEDYIVTLVTPPACSGTPTAGTISASSASVCVSGSVTLTATGYTTGETGISFQWYNSAGLIPSATAATYVTPVLSAPESYYFRVTCANSGASADSNTVAIGVNNPSVTGTTNGSRCGVGSVTLAATGSAGSTLNWFANPTGGTPLATGSPFATPSISGTTTYYVSASEGGSAGSLGPVSPAVGAYGTSFTGSYEIFTVTTPVTLTSVDVFPTGAGTVIVELLNSSGTVLQTSPTYTVTAAQANTTLSVVGTPVNVPVNFAIPAGTGYRLNFKSTSTATLVRNSGGAAATYGPVLGVTITGNSNATVGYYYNFYNWALTSGCFSSRTAVVATVNAPPALTISAPNATICAGSSTTVPLTITSNVADFDTYSWSPSGGVSGNSGTGYLFAPPTTTTYTLTATNTTSGCANTATFTVTVNPNPVAITFTPAAPIMCSIDGPVLISNFTGTLASTTGGCLTATSGQYPAGTYSAVTCNGTTSNSITTLAYAGEYSVVAVSANTKYVFSSSGAGDYVTISNAAGTTVLATGASPITWISSADTTVRFYSHTDAACGELDEFRERSFTCLAVSPPVVYTPTTGLYTDAAGTIAYTGTPTRTVYAKPAATQVYNAVATSGSGCSVNGQITVTVNQATTWYVDADGDGYGNSALATQLACTQPSGYAAVGGDCNDAVAAINPGAAEIPFNGVDDNCNGTIDETGTVTTTLLASSCGTTLASIGSLVGIQTVGGHPITGYRIRITNGAQVQVIETNVPHFTFPQFPSYAYATTYTVEIQLQRAGLWQASWGAPCLVSTPAILESGGAGSINPSQCGITLAKINTLIATTSLAGVTGYRFQVTNLTDPLGPNAVQTIDRVQNWFSLQMLTRYNYGTTYRIEVAVKTTGTYGGFGAPCEVSSPAVPSLVNCGGTVAAGTTTVAATSVAGATQYRFQITRQSDNATSTIDRNTNYFTFNMVPATTFTAGALYNVRVAVMTAGTWSPFGDACEITAPGGSAKGIPATTAATASAEFKAIALPNPFTADFQIDVTTSSQENVQLKVYDMLGKLVESREVKVSDLNMEKVGAQYPSGVYNVIVSQDGIVKTLRVIKR